MEREFVWLSPLATEREFATRTITVHRKPDRVWTLLGHSDRNRPPHPRLVPVHGQTAFIEERVHDWAWKEGVLRYYSRVVDRRDGVWLLLEYK